MQVEFEEHINLFTERFVRKDKRHRWETILSTSNIRWDKLSAYDCVEAELADWNTSIYEQIVSAGLNEFLEKQVVVYPIGHGALASKGPYKTTLQNALLGDEAECECVISIYAGKLAICYGHSNEFRLCKRD